MIQESTAQAVLSEYRLGKRHFNGLDFQENEDFKNSNLEQALFENCFFNSADFEYANLVGTVFKNCNLKCSNFNGADLKNATIENSFVEATSFVEAKLDNFLFKKNSYYGLTVDKDAFDNKGKGVFY